MRSGVGGIGMNGGVDVLLVGLMLDGRELAGWIIVEVGLVRAFVDPFSI